VGIASGAYSSIFIAAPLLTIWKEREPEYARRKDIKVTKAGLEDVFEEAEEEEAAAELAPAPVARVDSANVGATRAQQKRERRRHRRRAS
jgi:SecD/SecF fusion protein